MIGQYLDGKYEIKSEIGRGGMGVVYGGFDHALKRRVAVKILAPQLTIDPRSVERFRREAVAAASLQHPNIVTIYDVGAHVFGERSELVANFIVMEYLNGKTLEEWAIQGNGRMPVKQVVHVATQTASALDYAHSRGIVHRDIKPSNIMLSEQGRLTLMDFGLVRVGEVSGLTVSGIVIGTPEYISPEQALGHEADGRSDIYSFGVVVFRLLTGTIPFARATPLATAHAHAYEPAPPLRRLRADLPKSMETVLLKAMAKDPGKRYAESGQFARDLSLASSGKMPPGLKFTLAVSLPGSKDPSPVKQNNLTRTPGLPATLAPEAAGARVVPHASNLKGGRPAPPPARSKSGSSFRPLLVVVAILLGIAGIAGLAGTLSRSTREASPRPGPAVVAEVGPPEQRVAGQAGAAGSNAVSNPQTPSPTAEFASTATQAPSPSPSPVSGLAQAAALASQSGTATATVTARPSPTALPTSTPVPTSTPTTKPTRTPTSTSRPSPTALRTSTPLATNTPTLEPTLQATSTPRPSPTANATNTQQPAGPLTPTPRSILYVYYTAELGYIVSTQPDTTDSPELRIGVLPPGAKVEVIDQVKVGDVTFLEIREQEMIPHGFVPYYNTIMRLAREEVYTPPTPTPAPLNQRVVNTADGAIWMFTWPGSNQRVGPDIPVGGEATLLRVLKNWIEISYQGTIGWTIGSTMTVQ